MVGLGADGEVVRFEVKPGRSELEHTWILAAWGPVFTDFLHTHLDSWSGPDELAMSRVFEAALGSGLGVRGLVFDDGEFLDIGTPDDLRRLRSDHRWRAGSPSS